MPDFHVRIPADLLNELTKKATEAGITNSELARIALASFLNREDSLSEYLEAIEGIHSQLAVLAKRQEQFARSVGSVALTPESFRNADMNQKFADRISQIVDTVN